MNLLLDIGNTRLKWAVQRGSELDAAQALVHAGDPAALLQSQASPFTTIAAPTRVWIASVMGADHDNALQRAVQQRWGQPAHFARSSAQAGGLRNAYAEPQRLGVDRWLAMLALWSRWRAPFCIASAGTALTFDAVNAHGQHLGGVIAPGLHALIDATLGRTRFAVAGLDDRFDDGLGQSTEAGVRQGALHAAAGLLDRLAARHAGARVLAGGDARVLQPWLADDWQLEEDLVLRGLAVLAGIGPA